MMLAGMLKRHPCELRADFQRYYGLNLDDLGTAYTYRHAADLAACLPRESSTIRAESPALEWTEQEYMLWSIEYSLRVLRWQNTEDGRKGRNKPEKIPTPMEIAKVREKVEATDMQHIADVLGIELNEGVDNG